MTDFAYDGQVERGVGSVANGDLVVIVLDDTYVFVPEHDTVADVAAHEIVDAGRQVITATRELIDGTWYAMAASVPAFDLTGIDNRGGVVVARQAESGLDADRKLVAWTPDTGPGVNPYEPDWVSGIVTDSVKTSDAELAAHIANLTAHGLPAVDADGADDGKVLVVADGALVLATDLEIIIDGGTP